MATQKLNLMLIQHRNQRKVSWFFANIQIRKYLLNIAVYENSNQQTQPTNTFVEYRHLRK